jgi:hypothetical protein
VRTRRVLRSESDTSAKHMLALPAFREWEFAALTEHDFVVEDEPYRKR